jgi:hypothetical protein
MYVAYDKKTNEPFAWFPKNYTKEYMKYLLSQMGLNENEYYISLESELCEVIA